MLGSLTFIRTAFNRAERGLFAGRKISFGNNVSFSERKTRRTWLPNVQSKKLFSDILGQHLQLKVTTQALRHVKKMGGLDNYLLKVKPRKLYSARALELRDILLLQLKARETQTPKDEESKL